MSQSHDAFVHARLATWQRRINVDVLIQEMIERGLVEEEERLRASGS